MQVRYINELTSVRTRLQADNTDLARQLEESEAQVAMLNRQRQQNVLQLEEAKRAIDQSDKDRHNAQHQVG